MKCKKTVTSLTLAAVMAGTLLAGCGSSSSTSSASSGSTGISSATSSSTDSSASSGSVSGASSETVATSSNGSSGTAEVTKPDGYPSKNVQVIVPFSAGGNTDMSTRALLNAVSEAEGITFVVDNKTGNGGLIGMEALADSDPDGYTLGAVAVDFELHVCFGRTEKTIDDFTPIAATMADPYGILISSSNPNYSTLEEFVDYAKANPGAVKVGTTGNGAAPHVAAMAFAKALGIEFDYYAYEGSADCVTAIASGEIDATFTQPTPAVAQLEAGTEKMIAFMSDDRLDTYPDVPTVNEVYSDATLVMRGWVMVAAPAGIPDDIKDYLTSVFAKALGTQEYKDALTNMGMTPVVIYGDDLQKMIDDDMEFYKKVCADIEVDS